MRSVERTLESLHQEGMDAPAEGWPAGAPAHEFLRSPASTRVGRLASRQGLFLFHFEHRTRAPVIAGDTGSIEEAPEWVDGVLPEPKYAAFRHDLAVGSFHPGHRAKWTTHELCHALVGFAWRPEAGRLFHATAARLAELLPVALWYGLDEVRLRRCPVHAGQGPLHQTFCRSCEEAAFKPALVRGARDRRFVEQAHLFLEEELAAIAKTRRLGRPVAHRWGAIDLCSDGLAYAVSHEERLTSDVFGRFAQRFLVHSGGWVSTLEALEARVVEVADALCEQAPLSPLSPSPQEGRWRWTIQDLAWRLHVIGASLDGDRAREVESILEDLASQPAGEEAVASAVTRYALLARDGDAPGAEDVFAVGYDLPGGYGRCVPQIADGLGSVVPLTLGLMDDAMPDQVDRFVEQDEAVRVPLGERFAAHLTGDLGQLARYESALRSVRFDPFQWTDEPGSVWEVSPEPRVLHGPWDWVRLAERVEAGGVALSPEGGLRSLDGEPVCVQEDRGLGIARDRQGGLVVAELTTAESPDQAKAVEPDKKKKTKEASEKADPEAKAAAKGKPEAKGKAKAKAKEEDDTTGKRGASQLASLQRLAIQRPRHLP